MTFWGNKRAGRGHDFPRRSLHLRIALGKLLERSSQNTDEMEVQSEPKINKKWPKNRPQEGYPIGSGASFSIYFGCLGGSGCQVCLGRCFGRLLGGSWSRLGVVLGPKMDPVTPKFPPKPNRIGVLGRLEGPLERPRSVLGASWCVLKQLPASHTKKYQKMIQFWCPRT